MSLLDAGVGGGVGGDDREGGFDGCADFVGGDLNVKNVVADVQHTSHNASDHNLADWRTVEKGREHGITSVQVAETDPAAEADDEADEQERELDDQRGYGGLM